MGKRILIPLLLAICLLGGCFNRDYSREKGDDSRKDDIGIVDSEEEVEVLDPIAEKIKSMSIEEKIGQMFIVGIEGVEINEETKKFIQEYRVGGIILYGKNITDSRQLLDLINSIKEFNKKEGNLPLFISIDEEGGRVSRMPDEFRKFPSNLEIGKLRDAAFSYEIGKTIAEEISLFGINMNYGPVLDVNSNPKNPVIGDRSFSHDTEVVKELGISTMKGLKDGGIIPVIKHFPGHGDTSVDSHLELPSVDKDLRELKELELIPFIGAISEGADAVMVAHILLRKIDSQYPATLSKQVIMDVLRDELGFEGVVITDDMTMGAIRNHYGIKDAVVKSIEAGSDIILIAHDFEKKIEGIEAVKKAIEEGILSEERIDESLYRILKLNEKYEIEDGIKSYFDGELINKKIDNLLNKLKELEQF